MMMKQIRAITGKPSHITHQTDDALLLEVGLSNVANMIADNIHRHLRTAHGDWCHGPGDVIWLQQALEVTALATSNMTPVTSPTQECACPACGVYFPSVRAVKIHMRRKHAAESQEDGSADAVDTHTPTAETCNPTLNEVETVTEVRTDGPADSNNMSAHSQNADVCTQANQLQDKAEHRGSGQAGTRKVTFDRKLHSKDGLPTCAGCHKTFTKWPGLRKHIEAGYCPVLTSDVQPSNISTRSTVTIQAVVDREDVKQAYRVGKHKALLSNQTLLQELKQRCALCHTWVASSWMMKNHMHNNHGGFMKRHAQHCLDLCKQWGTVTKPCRYCGGNQNKADAKHLQKCTPLWQCIVIHHKRVMMPTPMADVETELGAFFGAISGNHHMIPGQEITERQPKAQRTENHKGKGRQQPTPKSRGKPTIQPDLQAAFML